MALNKVIVTKIRKKTENFPELGNYLIKLLEYESEPHGWYKADYNKFLEKACKEGEADENQ